jgi:hypothetical protein
MPLKRLLMEHLHGQTPIRMFTVDMTLGMMGAGECFEGKALWGSTGRFPGSRRKMGTTNDGTAAVG